MFAIEMQEKKKEQQILNVCFELADLFINVQLNMYRSTSDFCLSEILNLRERRGKKTSQFFSIMYEVFK